MLLNCSNPKKRPIFLFSSPEKKEKEMPITQIIDYKVDTLFIWIVNLYKIKLLNSTEKNYGFVL